MTLPSSFSSDSEAVSGWLPGTVLLARGDGLAGCVLDKLAGDDGLGVPVREVGGEGAGMKPPE